MKVVMIRKAANLQELTKWTGQYKDTMDAVIEKTLELSAAEFKSLSENLLQDRSYITENISTMRFDDATETWHCLAVTTPGSDTVILIESEGYDYARYTALISKKNLS